MKKLAFRKEPPLFHLGMVCSFLHSLFPCPFLLPLFLPLTLFSRAGNQTLGLTHIRQVFYHRVTYIALADFLMGAVLMVLGFGLFKKEGRWCRRKG